MEEALHHNALDLRGKRFGRLIAVRPESRSKQREIIWHCVCDCGGSKNVRQSALGRGATESCGCLKREYAQKLGGSCVGSRKVRLPHGVASFNAQYHGYKHGAQQRGLEWDLTKDKCKELFESDCYYCGKEPSIKCKQSSGSKNAGSYMRNGIDRVDNKRGYLLDNCVPCCTYCNQAKKASTLDEFIGMAIRIARIHGKESL